jgi:transposase
MIPVPSGVRVWLAVGRTDMRKGMNSLALQVQEALGRDPHAGDLYVFRGARADLIKIIWHDGIGMSLYAKRLEHGRFRVAITGRRHVGDLGGAAGLPARRDRRAQSAAYVPAAAGGIDRRIFRESLAGICDSLPAWRRPATTCRKRSTRCARR